MALRGGFEKEEIELALAKGIVPITLGKRILAHRDSGLYPFVCADVSAGRIGEELMEAYLDNLATTRCYESVAELVRKTMLEDYGNSSSMTGKAWRRSGMSARRRRRLRRP